MVHYIIQIVAFQLLFLLTYDLFLKKETFFNLNRAYLLITPILSLVLPFVRVEKFKEVVPQEYVFYLPEGLIGVAQKDAVIATNWLSSISTFQWILFLGSLASLFLFIFKLVKIYALKMQGKKIKHHQFTEIIIEKSTAAFSFFRNIFLGEEVLKKEHKHIIQHELVHINQKHSLDLIFFEILRIVFWFNPLIYIYQSRITELHEFIADAHTVKTNKKEHYQHLLEEVFKTEKISFINQFFNHSLIKKRIVMLQKSKSKKVWQLKYLLLVPVLIGMLIYTSCEKESSSKEVVNVNSSKNQVKYFEEFKARIENGEKYLSIADEVFAGIKEKDEIYTEDEFYRFNGFVLLNNYISIKNGRDGLEETALKTTERTYEEYLVWANSPEGKKTRDLSRLIKEYDFDSVENDVLKAIEIPFSSITVKPSFKNAYHCDEGKEHMQCFMEQLNQHVIKNFKYPKEAYDKKIEGKVFVKFKINEEGIVEVMEVRTPYKLLSDEARRIIEALPQFNPGTNEKGELAPVTFAYPIVFKLKK